MSLVGLLLAWSGIMGVLAVVAALVILRSFADVFSHSGAAVAWPWRRSESIPARLRGGVLSLIAAGSLAVALAGLLSFVRR